MEIESPSRLTASELLAPALCTALVVLWVAGCSDSSAPGSGGRSPPGVSVSIAGVVGTVPPCPAGTEHPNVCCVSGPERAAQCTSSSAAPFARCPAESLTFPDPATCCVLDGLTPCSPLADSGAASSGAGASCFYPCGPDGFLPAPDGGTDPFCADVGNDVPCSYCCTGTGPGGLCVTNSCSCPNQLPGAPPCQCGPQCGACPAGWSAPQGFPDQCCQTGPSGTARCFSQATSIMAVHASDVQGCFSTGSSCDCSARTADGHALEVKCDSGKACVCMADGTVTGTASGCSLAQCGFDGGI